LPGDLLRGASHFGVAIDQGDVHAGVRYRLRLTRRNKLILQK
jgi:hemin uptake protein HemP